MLHPTSQQAQELIGQSRMQGGLVLSPLALLGLLADTAVFCCESGEQLQFGLERARSMARSWDTAWAPAAAGLESYLQREGYDPLLTASELRALPLLLAGGSAVLLAHAARAEGAQQRSRELAAQVRAAPAPPPPASWTRALPSKRSCMLPCTIATRQGADAFRQLVDLYPSRPALKLHYSMCLQMGPPSQGAAAVAALREAFRQADASTGGQRCCCRCCCRCCRCCRRCVPV